MPKVIINNVEYDGQVGERLIDVARRNAAHIGLFYDGLGAFFVESTACRVLRGAEQLNPPTDFEQSWFQHSWLEQGHRLASEAVVQGSGTVEILSRAEELRRQTMAIFTPPPGTTSGENVGLLINTMSRIMMNQVARFPSNVMGSASAMTGSGQGTGLPNVQNVVTGIQQMVNDGTRIVQGMLGSGNNKP